jgi:hypothetical protein
MRKATPTVAINLCHVKDSLAFLADASIPLALPSVATSLKRRGGPPRLLRAAIHPARLVFAM